MARLLPEQLEFDFFAPPAPEQVKEPEKKTVSAAFKDTDIFKQRRQPKTGRFRRRPEQYEKRKVGSQKKRSLSISHCISGRD